MQVGVTMKCCCFVILLFSSIELATVTAIALQHTALLAAPEQNLITTARDQLELLQKIRFDELQDSAKNDDSTVFHGLRPASYDVQLQIHTSNSERPFTFEGSCFLLFYTVRPTDLIVLHAKDLNINLDAIRVENPYISNEIIIVSKIQYLSSQQMLAISVASALIAKNWYKLTIGSFSGNIHPGNTLGLFASVSNLNGPDYSQIIATQLQLDEARSVFPCMDLPRLKTNFTLQLKHSPEYTALSNTPVMNVSSDDRAWTITNFATTPKLPTYVVGFVLLPNNYVTIERNTISGILLRLHYNAYSVTGQHAAKFLIFAEYALNFLKNLFQGVPYPTTKIDLVILPDFLINGMENFAMITLSETYLLRQAEVDQLSLIAHELTHQWLSNMDTIQTWHELCFQEGLTEHMARKIIRSYYYNSTHLQEFHISNHILGMVNEDQYAPPATLLIQNATLQEVSGRCFGKAPYTLALLEDMVGQTNFELTTRKFANDFAYRTYTISDYLSYFNDLTIWLQPVRDIFTFWFETPGYPCLFIQRNYNAQLIIAKQIQIYKKAGAYVPMPTIWEIPFRLRIQNISDEFGPYWLREAEASYPIAQNTSSQSWLLANENSFYFYRVNYDHENWVSLSRQLADNPDVISTFAQARLLYDFCYFHSLGLIDGDVQAIRANFQAFRLNTMLRNSPLTRFPLFNC